MKVKQKGLFESYCITRNQVIILELENMRLDSIKILGNHILTILNERATGAQYEEAGWNLVHAPAESTETKQENNSLMDELERLGNMYEKRLLTDEEFAAMKKKLIE